MVQGDAAICIEYRGSARQGLVPHLYCVAPLLMSTSDNDISSGSYGIRQVRATLAGAFEMLQAGLFGRAEVMLARGGLSNESFDPADMSILSEIMGVTKEVRSG